MERVSLARILLAFFFLERYNSIEAHLEPEDVSFINGNRTNINNFPYFASLQGCSAAIISDIWVVTAAHCVYDSKLNPGKRLWVGGESVTKSQQIHYKKAIIHPQFKYFYQIPLNDIAVLQLTEPLKFKDGIKPIKLRAEIQNPHSELILVGKRKYDNEMQSKAIQSLEMLRLTPWECLKYIPKNYHRYIKPYLNMFDRVNVCTKSRNDDVGICLDESGSLLVQDHQLIGLLSYGGDRNCENNRVMFFTNVPNYVQWVRSVTGLK